MRELLKTEVLRRLEPLPQREQARKLGKSVTYVNFLRNGVRPLTDPLIRQIPSIWPDLTGPAMAALMEAPSPADQDNEKPVAV